MILVANIGNRNLLEAEEFIEKTDFLKRTKELLEQKEFNNLKINILDVVLQRFKDDIQRIVLFSSDQEEFKRTAGRSQDTLYAGEILLHLIRRHPVFGNFAWELSNQRIESAVMRVDGLIPEYQRQIRQLIKEHPGERLLVCNSGGTAQQKIALKIAVEYLLNERQYEFWQVEESLDNSGTNTAGQLFRLESNEYKKVIDALQVELLVGHGKYDAAATIWKPYIEIGYKKKLGEFLEFKSLRMRLLYEAAVAHVEVHFSQQGASRFTTTKLYLDGKTVEMSYYESLKRFIYKRNFLHLCEMLHLLHYIRLLGNWTELAIKLQIFVEYYVNSVLFNRTRINFMRDYKSAERELAKRLKSNKAMRRAASEGLLISEDKELRISLPTKINLTAYYCDNQINLRLVNQFRGFHSRFKQGGELDRLRDDIAHIGKGCDENELNQRVPGWSDCLDEWLDLFFQAPYRNPYLQANEEIVQYLKS